MPNLTRYFDKEPTRSYTLGPSGVNRASTGFYDVWQGWYQEGVGIKYIRDDLYNSTTPTGYTASGSQNILHAERFSFTFDSGAYMWAGISNANTINVFKFSGSSFTTPATFSGQYPVMFYNQVNNRPERRYVHCFYLKSGQNKIYSRSSQDNFSGEIIFHQDFDQQVQTLNYASRSPLALNKMEILGLYRNGDGFQMTSDCFFLFESGSFTNFSGYADGPITNLNNWECALAANFTEEQFMSFENFSAYPTGDVNYFLNSGYNTSGGYVWP